MTQLTVAAIQFKPIFKDASGNLRKMAALAAQAVNNGAEVLVYPELSTTGYSFMSKDEAVPFAEDIYECGGSVGIMQTLAAKLGVVIVWGLVEQDPGNKALYNSQALVTPEGIIAHVRKLNRWGNDYLWAKEGTAPPPVTPYKGHKLGLLICRDVRDKSAKLDSFYEKGDADIVCFSANWGKGGFPSGAWVDFAKNNKTTLVVANRYGEESHNDFGFGGSCIIAPDGEVNCSGLVWNQDCIVYGDVK